MVVGHRNKLLYDTAVHLLLEGKFPAFVRTQLKRQNAGFAEPLPDTNLDYVLASAKHAINPWNQRRLQ